MARRRSCGGKPAKNADMTLRATASVNKRHGTDDLSQQQPLIASRRETPKAT
jgi:hypothetical protein